MIVLTKEPPWFLCAWLDFGSVRCVCEAARGSVLWPSSCPAPGAMGGALPDAAFQFHFLFLIFFFFFVYFACFLYVFQLWNLKAPWSHLHFQSLVFPSLAPSCHGGRFNCLKIKGLRWGVQSCGQTSPGLKFQWELLTDTALRLSWVWPCPWSEEASSLECAELGKSRVPAQLPVHEHLWQYVWHRMSSAFFRDRKAVCVVAWYQSLEYWT